MSGPKVVRIVTREELVALCESLLGRAAAALEAWEQSCARGEGLTETEKAAGRARLASLRQMLTSDRFAELQKEVPREITFLRDDQRERSEKAVARAAAARSAERRRGDAAKALLSALAQIGKPVDGALRAALEKADPAALARGFALLSAPRENGGADRRALAARYMEGDEDRSLEAWLGRQPDSLDPRFGRLEAAVCEIAQLGDAALAASLESRIAETSVEPVGARRDLLIDSLQVDLAQALRARRENASRAADIRLDLAELAALDMAQQAAEFERRLGAVLVGGGDLTKLASEVVAAAASGRAALAARARRDAVLQSLAGLGYEVTEGLSTAWVADGKVVLRKADRPDYGVEISGDAGAARLQMRAVAFDGAQGGPDPSRDRDAETLWCGDVSALKAQLSQAGGDLVIEKALAIGATPLKRVEVFGQASGAATAEAPVQRTRTLR